MTISSPLILVPSSSHLLSTILLARVSLRLAVLLSSHVILDSTYSKPAESDSTFTKAGDSTFNRTQPSDQGGSYSYDITPARHELPPQPLMNEDNYGTIRHQVFQCANSPLGLEDLNSGTDTDDEDNPKKEVPKWAEGAALRTALLKQLILPARVREG